MQRLFGGVPLRGVERVGGFLGVSLSRSCATDAPIAELWRPKGMASATPFPSVSMSGATNTWSRQSDARQASTELQNVSIG